MKGVNTLKINQATMLEAINLWLAAEYKTPPKAKSVDASTTNKGGFDILLDSQQESAPNPD